MRKTTFLRFAAAIISLGIVVFTTTGPRSFTPVSAAGHSSRARVALSAAGEIDPTFNAGIFTAWPAPSLQVNTVAQQPDGKLIIGGVFASIQGSNQWSIARLNPDGSLDTTFTSPFLYTSTETRVSKIIILPDGKLLVGGGLNTSSGTRRLVRLNADGTIDPSFFAALEDSSGIFSRLSDGKIVCATTVGVKHLNPDGSLDTSFPNPTATDPDPITNIRDLTVDVDDKVIVTGVPSSFILVGRYNQDGTLDSTFNSTGIVSIDFESSGGYVYDLVARPDRSLLISGNFNQINGNPIKKIARITQSGMVDPSFVPVVSAGLVQDSSFQADGKIIAVGRFFFSGDPTPYQVARFDQDGSLDASFSRIAETDSSNVVLRSFIQADGKPIVAGNFLSIAGASRSLIARLLAAGSQNSQPLLSNVLATSPIAEGASTILSGNISDADTSDPFTLTVNWGDGSLPQVYNYPAGTTSFSESHVYADNPSGQPAGGSYSVELLLSDGNGGSDTDSTSVTVNNASPSSASVSASPSILSVGESTTLNGAFSDAGLLDSFTVIINWGDGTAPTQLNLPSGSTSFSSSHQFTSAGSFTVTATITDDDGGSASASTGVTVNSVTAPPSAPTGLAAVAVSATQIGLTWTDTSSDESGFRIERCNKGKNCTNFVEIASVGSGSTSFQDTTVAKGTAYRYRIQAFNDGGNSAYSNIATAKTPRR